MARKFSRAMSRRTATEVEAKPAQVALRIVQHRIRQLQGTLGSVEDIWCDPSDVPRP